MNAPRLMQGLVAHCRCLEQPDPRRAPECRPKPRCEIERDEAANDLDRWWAQQKQRLLERQS